VPAAGGDRSVSLSSPEAGDLVVARATEVAVGAPLLEASAESRAPEGPGSEAGVAAPTATSASSGSDQLDELARKLFPELMFRLRGELLVERERRGRRTDAW
jgi:hypothetical protein